MGITVLSEITRFTPPLHALPFFWFDSLPMVLDRLVISSLLPRLPPLPFLQPGIEEVGPRRQVPGCSLRWWRGGVRGLNYPFDFLSNHRMNRINPVPMIPMIMAVVGDIS